MKRTEMKQIQIYLEPDIKTELDEYCKKNQISKQWLIEEYIEEIVHFHRKQQGLKPKHFIEEWGR